ASLGVGRNSLIKYSAVTVHGGLSAPVFCIRCQAADQLQWQSSNVPVMPPLNMPSNASYSLLGCHSATTSSPSGKLRTCKPFGFAGPQPKHARFGAYVS